MVPKLKNRTLSHRFMVHTEICSWDLTFEPKSAPQFSTLHQRYAIFLRHLMSGEMACRRALLVLAARLPAEAKVGSYLDDKNEHKKLRAS